MSKMMMTTYTGRHIDPLDLQVNDICIEDIAHSLSLLCRFGGHTNCFYSVAQHSVRVANLLPKHMVLEGLLHDATEAYVQDIIRPVKVRLPVYKTLESAVWRVIAFRFGLSQNGLPEVIEADNSVLKSELDQFMDHGSTELEDPWWDQFVMAPPVPYALTPGEAEGLFMATYVTALTDRAAWFKVHAKTCIKCTENECDPQCEYVAGGRLN